MAALWPRDWPAGLYGVRASGVDAPDRAAQSAAAVRAARTPELLPVRAVPGLDGCPGQPGPVYRVVPPGVQLERPLRLARARDLLRADLRGADRDPAPPAGHASPASRQRGPAAGSGPQEERI